MKGFKKVAHEEFINFTKSYKNVTQWNQTIADRIDYKDENNELISYINLIDKTYYIKK